MMKKKPGFDGALRALGRAKAPRSLPARVYLSAGLADAYVVLPSEIGDVHVAYGPRGVIAVRQTRGDVAYERWHRKTFGRSALRDSSPPAELVASLTRRLAGKAGRDSVKIDLGEVTPFQRSVLDKAREIPRGQVRSYAWVAQAIGHPRAVRAVGTALASNPVPLLIPCHRVVRSDGLAGSYVFGEAVKRALLAREGVGVV